MIFTWSSRAGWTCLVGVCRIGLTGEDWQAVTCKTSTRRSGARRHTGASASELSGRARSEAIEMPAGSLLVNDVGFQTSKKRKPAVALDGTRQVKRTCRRRSRCLDPRGPTQVGIIQFGPTQKQLMIALFLDDPSCYFIHTTPSSPHNGTVSVLM